MEPEKKEKDEKSWKAVWVERGTWVGVSLVCFIAYMSLFTALIASAFKGGGA
jgi:hypothetical protein